MRVRRKSIGLGAQKMTSNRSIGLGMSDSERARRDALLASHESEIKAKKEQTETLDVAAEAAVNRRKASCDALQRQKSLASDDLMPYRKPLTRRSSAQSQAEAIQAVCAQESASASQSKWTLLKSKRKTMMAMENFLSVMSSGLEKPPVTGENIRHQLVVVRGPGWRWDDEDGGAGKPGTVCGWDAQSGKVAVFWHETKALCSHYSCIESGDLCLAPEGLADPSPEAPICSGLKRQNSYLDYATRSQTIIILDWDDTLFPTTFVRDDLQLSWKLSLAKQNLQQSEQKAVASFLKECEENAKRLLLAADKIAKVVLVTLAKPPWVNRSCENFFPELGKVIEEIQAPVIYAQEDAGTMEEYNAQAMASDYDIEMFWSKVKGRAIAKQISHFYSQYEGQSWKNVISIGDSNFERLGTFSAVEDYMRDRGLPVNMVGAGLKRMKTTVVEDKVFKVRVKTFKMIEQPTVAELTDELGLILRWLPSMVALDSGCDFDLETLEDEHAIRIIERTLKASHKKMQLRTRDGKVSSTSPRAPSSLGNSSPGRLSSPSGSESGSPRSPLSPLLGNTDRKFSHDHGSASPFLGGLLRPDMVKLATGRLAGYKEQLLTLKSNFLKRMPAR